MQIRLVLFLTLMRLLGFKKKLKFNWQTLLKTQTSFKLWGGHNLVIVPVSKCKRFVDRSTVTGESSSPVFPLWCETAQLRSTTRPFAQWNLILAHKQHSNFKREKSLFWTDAERFWAYCIAHLEAIWIKCVLCLYFDKIFYYSFLGIPYVLILEDMFPFLKNELSSENIRAGNPSIIFINALNNSF